MTRDPNYGNVFSEPTANTQVDTDFQLHRSGHRTLRLSERIMRLAQDEYDRQFPGQPYERIQQRGGLSVLEVVGLLADHVERLKGREDAGQ